MYVINRWSSAEWMILCKWSLLSLVLVFAFSSFCTSHWERVKARRQGRLHFLKNAAEYIAPILLPWSACSWWQQYPSIVGSSVKGLWVKGFGTYTYQFVLSKDKYSLLIYLALGLVVQLDDISLKYKYWDKVEFANKLWLCRHMWVSIKLLIRLEQVQRVYFNIDKNFNNKLTAL